MNYEQKLKKENELINQCFEYLSNKENQEGFKLTFNKRGRKDAERCFKLYLQNLVNEIHKLDFKYNNQNKEPVFTDSEIDDMINEALNEEL